MSETSNELDGQTLAPDRLPIIDLGPLLQDNDPAPVSSAMLSACKDLGFFYICNHGIDNALREEYFAGIKELFRLPIDEKLKLDARTTNAHRGYFPIYAENNDPNASLDFKEGFDIMAEISPKNDKVVSGVPFHGPNQWPSGLPSFKDTTLDYYRAMTALAEKLMQAIAVALKLPSSYFSDKLGGPFAMLRMLRYPPQLGKITKKEIGTGAHTDYGLLTILAQDTNRGLQIETPDEGWIDAPSLPGKFIVNIGDGLQRWSNDIFNSNPHRVINISGVERYSSPFFFHAAYDTVIECLPTCIETNQIPKYPPITAGEYMWQRFVATFSHHQGSN